MMLFFGVNNSYFSPHKMDTVEATSIIVGTGAVITVEMVIQLLCALAVAGLTVGLICEWQDMDLEALLNDVHDWLADNLDVLDSINIDGTSALKEWAQADEWEVIIGGSAPNPSPDPDNNDDNTDTSFSTLSPFTLTNLAELAVGGYYAAQELFNTSIPLDDGYLDLANEYMEDKIEKYPDAENELDDNRQPLDPITDALQYRYGNQSVIDSVYYDGVLNGTAPLKYEIAFNCTYLKHGGLTSVLHNSSAIVNDSVGVRPYLFIDSYGSCSLYCYYMSSGKRDFVTLGGEEIYTDIRNGSTSTYGLVYIINGQYEYGYESYAINVPIFNDTESLNDYLNNGDDSGCINILSPNNYIDTDDDYGWASTAALSPSDLASLMPEIKPLLNNHEVSLNNLSIAINALKEQLEEQKMIETPIERSAR